MAQKYENLDRLGSFDEGFQQVPLVQNFWKLHNIVTKMQK